MKTMDLIPNIGINKFREQKLIQSEGSYELRLVLNDYPLSNLLERFYLINTTNNNYLQSDGNWAVSCTPKGWYLTFDDAIKAVELAKSLGNWNPE